MEQRGLKRFLRVEYAALLAVAVIVFLFLRSHYRVNAGSDPGIWYLTGINLPEMFSTTKRAYFFPLLVWVAAKLTDPTLAFLVNIPVVLALVLVLALFARRATSGGGAAPTFAALAVVPLLFWTNADMLLNLCCPFRDALSHLLLFAALLLLADFRRDASHRLWRIMGCGALFALAVSTRETAAILIPAIALYAIIVKLRDRGVPFVKPALALTAAGAVFAVPLLVQNYLVAGNPFVPGQTTMPSAIKGVSVAGISVYFARETLPQVLMNLGERLSWPVMGAAVFGLVAFARKQGAAERFCLLAVPALLHIAFYGCYVRVVSRYLFIVDLFVIVLAATGIGALLAAALSWRVFEAHRSRAELLLTIAFVAGIAAQLSAIPVPHPRFTLEKLRAFQRHLDANLPADACLLGERPLGDYLRALAPRPAEVVDFITPKASMLDPAWDDELRRLHTAHPFLFYAGRSDSFELAHVRTELDAEYFATVPGGKLGMGAAVGGDFDLFRLHRWTALQTETNAVPPAADELFVIVNVGRLSSYKGRTRSEVSINGRIVDRAPRDENNVYFVRREHGEERIRVALHSDQPVPQNLRVFIQPASQPLVLTYKGPELIANGHRLSDDFKVMPRNHLVPATYTQTGTLDLPTPTDTEAGFDVTLDVGLSAINTSFDRCMEVRVMADARELVRSRVRDTGYTPLRFHIGPDLATSHTTRITFQINLVPGHKSGPMSLRRATIALAKQIPPPGN